MEEDECHVDRPSKLGASAKIGLPGGVLVVSVVVVVVVLAAVGGVGFFRLCGFWGFFGGMLGVAIFEF